MLSHKCECGWKTTSRQPVRVYCHRCNKLIAVGGDPAATIVGRSRESPWVSLHTYPVKHWSNWNQAIAKRWYWNEWLPMAIDYLSKDLSCACAAHWAELTTKHKPVFSSAAAFERWAYDRHDDVSRIHSGAPRISFETCRKTWRAGQ